MSRDMIMRAGKVVWSDLVRAAGLFFFATTLLATWHCARLAYGDPKRYYSYQGSTGPYALLHDEGDHRVLGLAQAIFRPGEAFAWETTACVVGAETVHVHTTFVRLAQAGLAEEVVDHRETSYTAQDHRCGARIGTQRVGTDALPGTYEERRCIVVREGGWWPVSLCLRPITVQVSPLTAPVEGMQSNP